MMLISRFFENHLDDAKISAEELFLFVEDHEAKLKTAGGTPEQVALYRGLLGALTPLFAEFDAKLSTRNSLLATLEGDTISKDDALRLFRATIRQREGRVRDAFGKGSPEYEEFFPRGLTEYARARVGNVPQLMDRVVTAATRHQAKLGAELVAEFTALKTKFNTAREGQVDQKGSVAEARTALATARLALELQVSRNILQIAAAHVGTPSIATQFFTQSLLEDPTRLREEAPPAPPAG